MFSFFGMALTGKQCGGRKLHWIYRLMIVFIALTIVASFLYVQFGS